MLPRVFRLVRTKDFDYLYRRGERLTSAHLLIRVSPNRQLQSRFGVVVSTKLNKRATVRNRYKRQLRAALQNLLSRFPKGWDIMITVRQPLEKGTAWPVLRAELTNLLERRFLA